MGEFKGTKGKWYIERTSTEDGDFQARILSNIGKVWQAGEKKDQIMIIVGEPTKRNGQSNIHSKANALLISKAPEMLEMLIKISKIEPIDGKIKFDLHAQSLLKQLISEATELN